MTFKDRENRRGAILMPIVGWLVISRPRSWHRTRMIILLQCTITRGSPSQNKVPISVVIFFWL